MSCRLINISNKGEVKSILWGDLNKEFKDENLTDEMYTKLFSSEFINKFGFWYPKDITFLRHSITPEDEKGLNSGWNDISLSKNGKEESRQIAKELKEKGITILYHSPIKRAVETAYLIKEEYPEINLISTDFLKPWKLGKYESKSTKDFAEKYYVDNPDEVPEGGESFNTMKYRFTSGLNTLLPTLENTHGLLTHSKVVDLAEGLQSTLGVWTNKSKEEYFAKGIDDRSKDNVWKLRSWNTEIATKNSNIGEPRTEDALPILKEISPKIVEKSEDLVEETAEVPKVSEAEVNTKMIYALEKEGVPTEFLKELRDSETGKAMTSTAKVEMLNKMVQVSQHNVEPTMLPPEAANASIELLDPNSTLLRKMTDQIISFQIYKQVLADNKGKKEYRNADGTINYFKIKKEAVAQALASVVIKEKPLTEESIDKEIRLPHWWEEINSNNKRTLKNFKDTNPFADISELITHKNTADFINDPLVGNLIDSGRLVIDCTV